MSFIIKCWFSFNFAEQQRPERKRSESCYKEHVIQIGMEWGDDKRTCLRVPAYVGGMSMNHGRFPLPTVALHVWEEDGGGGLSFCIVKATHKDNTQDIILYKCVKSVYLAEIEQSCTDWDCE